MKENKQAHRRHEVTASPRATSSSPGNAGWSDVHASHKKTLLYYDSMPVVHCTILWP